MLKSQYTCSVEGLNLERFLNTATREGVVFRQLKRESGRRLVVSVRVTERTKIERIAQAGGWKTTDMGVCDTTARIFGIGKHRWRNGLLIVMLCMLIAASRCILDIDIVNAGPYAADIRSYLTEIGISTPMLKMFFDIERVRELLTWRYPELAFMECSLRGTTLCVSVSAGQSSDMSGHDASKDIVAARDGIIISVVTSAGTPLVKTGDIVRKGEVLIIGEEKDRDGAVTVVNASGSIMARTWNMVCISVPATETVTQYTGTFYTQITVASPWFPLWDIEKPAYEKFDTHRSTQMLGGIFLPFSVQRYEFAEYDVRTAKMNKDTAMEIAAETALQKLIEGNGFHDDFVDKWVEYSMIDNETVCASAYGERIIDIAANAE